MKKFALFTMVAFGLCASAAVAQAGGPGGAGSSTGAQGTQGSSPSMNQTSPGQPAGTQMPGTGTNNSGMDQNGAPNTTNNTSEKHEKKLKGCVQSQGGQYSLEMKHGKTVALTGQDVSAHVGHEVAVKGSYENGPSGNMSATSSSNSGASSGEKTFNVASVDMISDTCKENKNNSSMGAGANNSKMGTGSSTGTGTSNDAGSNSGTGSTTGGSSTGSSGGPPQL
jgi:hypothetical protein